jgi:hypothetical protein
LAILAIPHSADKPLICCRIVRLSELGLQRRPSLKVLFTTGYTRNAIVHNGMLDPDVHLLPKPFTLEELAGKVRRSDERLLTVIVGVNRIRQCCWLISTAQNQRFGGHRKNWKEPLLNQPENAAIWFAVRSLTRGVSFYAATK